MTVQGIEQQEPHRDGGGPDQAGNETLSSERMMMAGHERSLLPQSYELGGAAGEPEPRVPWFSMVGIARDRRKREPIFTPPDNRK
jgi:hypothetical protein